jgi:outer membrane protein assembly factor BamB
MWAKPIEFGGVVGGNYSFSNGMTFYTGLSYEGKFANPLIIYGRLYYNLPRSDAISGNGYLCVDLRTGEEIYWVNDTMPTFGQLFMYDSPNQHGVIPNGYLWKSVSTGAVAGTVWMAFDPLDGNWLFNLTNVPGTPQIYGPNGELLFYQLNVANKWLALWNNTNAYRPIIAESEVAGTSGTNFWQWRPVGKNINASTAYSWNITIPTLPTGSSILKIIPGDMLLGSSGSFGGVSAANAGGTVWAISLRPNSMGSLLWTKDYPAPAGNITRTLGPVDTVNRVFTMTDKETMQWLGYNIDDGSQLWGPVGSVRPYQYYGTIAFAGQTGYTAYGKLYCAGYGGVLYCYDTKTGKLLWSYGNGGPGNSTNSGIESPWGLYPLHIGTIADGKLYCFTGEHSPNVPPYKGARVRCINATDGTEIWTMLSWYAMGSFGQGSAPIADGYMIYQNVYDNRIYCVGKGPSATTVAASPDISVHGSSVLVKGTVTDTSAGAKQHEQAARFPNGVPAVSDESISEWMEYVYMQKPIPNSKGVEVSLDTLDPNGNFVHIGTATTDTSGLYSYMFTPEVPGKYTIIATFAGSNAYWGSYAETAIGVDEAPPTTQPPEYPQPIDNTMIIVGMGIAIIIAIAIVGLILARKK